jgi:hypothetical protein
VDKLKLYHTREMDLLRQLGDPLADQAILDLIADPLLSESINNASTLADLKALELPASVAAFFDFFQVTPDFLETSRCKVAQDFFEENSARYLSMLGFYALPYCYAFADGAQVLIRSKRIVSDIGSRLIETGLFVIEAFKPDGFSTHNTTLLSLAKVRLIHAFSRLMVLKHAKDWEPSWGIPINQEDQIGTNLAFSLIVTRGMEKIGSGVSKSVTEDLLHYWKVLGYYLGIQVEYWPETVKEAFELEKLIRKRHLRSSEAGIILVNSLLKFFSQNVPNSQAAQFTDALVAFLLGPEAAKALALKSATALPKPVFGLLLESTAWGSQTQSYSAMRNQFLKRAELQLGHPVALNIPVVNRS